MILKSRLLERVPPSREAKSIYIFCEGAKRELDYFEVWLYYHSSSNKPKLKDSEKCATWKQHVNQVFREGFDSRKHPIYIEVARVNAKENFVLIEDRPDLGCTEVYNLADSIVTLLKEKLEKVLKQIEGN